MYCKKCGSVIHGNATVCPVCGIEVNTPQLENDQSAGIIPDPHSKTARSPKLSPWLWIAIISFLCACFTFFKGIDKMVNYKTGDYYPYEPINAYVGGDAYNYIINANYATAFFVLTAMFFLAALLLVIVHYISRKKAED